MGLHADLPRLLSSDPPAVVEQPKPTSLPRLSVWFAFPPQPFSSKKPPDHLPLRWRSTMQLRRASQCLMRSFCAWLTSAFVRVTVGLTAGFSTGSPKLNHRSTCSSLWESNPLSFASSNRVSRKVAASWHLAVLTPWLANFSTWKLTSPKMTHSSWDWRRRPATKNPRWRHASRCGTTTRPCSRRTSSSVSCLCPLIALSTKYSNHSRKTLKIRSFESDKKGGIEMSQTHTHTLSFPTQNIQLVEGQNILE